MAVWPRPSPRLVTPVPLSQFLSVVVASTFTLLLSPSLVLPHAVYITWAVYRCTRHVVVHMFCKGTQTGRRFRRELADV